MKKDISLKIIILIIITTIIVGLAIFFREDHFVPENEYTYETDMFSTVNVKGALKLFENLDKASFLFIGRQYCQGCAYQGPILQIALAEYQFPVYYLDLNTIDTSKEETQELLKKLDFEYELYDKKGPFGSFLGYTPMLIIIKGGKQVYGHIGALDKDEIYELILKYGVITE